MADLVKAYTPIILAIMGGTIAICAIFSPNISADKFGGIIGLASTFAAGAAGLASPKNKD